MGWWWTLRYSTRQPYVAVRLGVADVILGAVAAVVAVAIVRALSDEALVADHHRGADREQAIQPKDVRFRSRMQPCEIRPGMSAGWLVPWMPMNPPAGQSVRTSERALVPNATGP